VELPANHLSRFPDTALWPVLCSSGLTCPGPSNGAPTTAPWSLKKKRRTRRGAAGRCRRACLAARIHPILAPLMRICTQRRMLGWVILLFHTDSASANIRSHPGPADANRSCTGPHVRAMRIPPLPLGTGVSPPPLPPVLSSEQHTLAIGPTRHATARARPTTKPARPAGSGRGGAQHLASGRRRHQCLSG
jgi:hypothetical protein